MAVNWDKVREWIKVGVLVAIAYSTFQIMWLLKEATRFRPYGP